MCWFESNVFRLFTSLLELVVRVVLETIVLKTCRFESYKGYKHINSSTHTADGGLSKIQFRAAGSRMLESVFIIWCLWCRGEHDRLWFC